MTRNGTDDSTAIYIDGELNATGTSVDVIVKIMDPVPLLKSVSTPSRITNGEIIGC